MSTMVGPLCPKFTPTEQCKIISTIKPDNLVVEEKIKYNDLVNSIQDDGVASGSKDAEPKKDPVLKDTRGDRGDPDPRVRLKRECVGIMAAFELKCPSRHLVIVAHTHLLMYQYLISGSSPMGQSEECLEDLPIPFSRVYAETRGEPLITNYTPGFIGTLDYIFFAPFGDIKPISYLQLLESESSDVGGVGYQYTSIQVPIGAAFVIVQ